MIPQYDIVMATRNRQALLPISLPLMLSQPCLPRNFFVVDASDDHVEVKKILEAVFPKGGPVRLEILCSRAGSSLQRNVGLDLVKSPVVFFPDDDALWFENFSKEILAVYALDVKEQIGGVCGTASVSPPPGTISIGQAYRAMDFRDVFALRLRWAINKVDQMFPNPLYVEGNIRNKMKKVPLWLQTNSQASISNLMTGFLMTFRTEVIRNKRGFDERLGRYALSEDLDASLAVLNSHLLARAAHACAFHYRVPEKRAPGFEYGFIQIANRAYILCKHTEFTAISRKYLERYVYYKLLKYILQAHTSYGRNRVLGAFAAINYLPAFLAATREEIPELYTKVRSKCCPT